jgi:hypothetical protein
MGSNKCRMRKISHSVHFVKHAKNIVDCIVRIVLTWKITVHAVRIYIDVASKMAY